MAIVGLLPVRNGAAVLPACLASMAQVCDAVVALDDGSTDETSDILHRCELVRTVLASPRRETYSGWDDGANRNRLLTAAADLAPDWIVSIDADERLDPTDAAALRQFLSTDAIRGCAYGLQCFGMEGTGPDGTLQGAPFNPHFTWVYRVFAYRPGQRFPDLKLNFNPVPIDLPARAWVRTTLRIQHLEGAGRGSSVRLAKYHEADPDRAFADYYERERPAPPEELPRWEPRPAGVPVLLPTQAQDDEADRPLAEHVLAAELDLDAPLLSAVVISRDDEAVIERTVRSVVDQECPEPFEVIVVTSGRDRTAQIVRERFPDVRLIELPTPALPGVARNAGLRVARGDYVSFPGSHVELPPGSLAARLRAHQAGYAMVTGTMLNGTHTPAGWASYFLDNSHCLPGRPSGPIDLVPARCSYERDALRRVGGFPEDMRAGEETIVNGSLRRLGYTAWRSNEIVLTHYSPCRTRRTLLRHHFQRGRGGAQVLLRTAPDDGRLLTRAFIDRWLVGYIPDRLAYITANVARWAQDERATYRSVYFLVVAGVVAYWAGVWFELARPARGKLTRLLGGSPRPASRSSLH